MGWSLNGNEMAWLGLGRQCAHLFFLLVCLHTYIQRQRPYSFSQVRDLHAMKGGVKMICE
jgi:hypothetical protein